MYRVKPRAEAPSPLGLISVQKLGLTWVISKQKSSLTRRPKKKIYHRVHELDRVMDLRKKPALILQLKSIIESQKHQCLLLRDLEKHVGFVQKWNYLSIIEKYPLIFFAGGGAGAPPFVSLTEKAKKIASEESEVRIKMEPILVKNLRKLLMLSVDCCIPLEKVEFIGSELGLPCDFVNTLVPKYPEFFSVKSKNGRDFLLLDRWDSSLAVTARESRLAETGVFDPEVGEKGIKISKDGNFPGPFAFNLSFPVGFRPNVSYVAAVEKWQRMEFPSPYLNARRFDAADPRSQKRVVAVLHELLSLTMEKRLTSAQLDSFHFEYMLPSKLILCLIKHHSIFYITNKGARSSVFLKEAYDGCNLVDKNPVLLFHDKFFELIGRKDACLGNKLTSSDVLTGVMS